MEFKISGKIKEKESQLPVPNLLVKAYDKDMLFDDLLGNAITSENGFFEINYTDKDFKEYFEKSADIYFSIHSPTRELLYSTKDSIKFNASASEYFEIEISSKVLGANSPVIPDNVVEGKLKVTEKHLKIKDLDGFQVPELPGFSPDGDPGEPTLPSQLQYIALPMGSKIRQLRITEGRKIKIDKINNPLPVQEPIPDLGIDPETGNVIVPDITFTSLHESFRSRTTAFPENLVKIENQESFGSVNFTAVRVNPVQFDSASNAYYFYPDLTYRIEFEKDVRVADSDETILTQSRGELVKSILDYEVVFPAKNLNIKIRPNIFDEVPYVIITDNYYWPDHILLSDGTRRPPILSERGLELNGDLIAEFERLAKWKTGKGVKTRVVTISEIADKKFGDMTKGGFARDLQEVIRNFVKHIQKFWNTDYVLMGGDVTVVPMKVLTGATTYESIGVGLGEVNPPERKKCFHINGKSVAKLYPNFIPDPTHKLSTYYGGVRIPFNREAGSGNLGWYYTNENDFNKKNTGFTRLQIGEKSSFIIVEGPDNLLEDSYYWLNDANSIPSDFYYSSLVGDGYSLAGKHDFDHNNNEMYGQSAKDVSLDGVDFGVDLFVGRASVESAAEAKGFVDKTISYEKFTDMDGQSLDPLYVKKVIYGADYWGGTSKALPNNDLNKELLKNQFRHVPGDKFTSIFIDFDLKLTEGSPSHRMVSRINTTDKQFAYNYSANSNNEGWYFTTDNTFSTKSATATKFIKVWGNEAQLNPTYFLFEPMGLELGAVEKEELRNQMNIWYPEFTTVQRHYADYFDTIAPPTVQLLNSNTFRDAIDHGVHFLSLTGHGSSNGCCGVNSSSRPDFKNKNQYFIAFADSCSTARPDGGDSLAEKSVNDPDGGAIAYVGNTRYSWIGTGHRYEQFFWNKMKSSLRPGVAANLRLSQGGKKSFWVSYAQNFFGDPELKAYVKVPKTLLVSTKITELTGKMLTVEVKSGADLIDNAKVTIMAGYQNSSTEPAIWDSKVTNEFGKTSFKLPESVGRGSIELSVCVTADNHIPTLEVLQLITRPSVVTNVV